MGKRRVYRVLVEKILEETTWETPAINGRIILRWIFRRLVVGGMDWIELAQDRNRWRAVVNAVMSLCVL
jgi:hypothetical protein